MGEVLKLRKPRRKTIQGAARAAYSLAMRSCGKPAGVVIVAIGIDGSFSYKSVSLPDQIKDFDLLNRAAAILDKRRMELIE